MAETILMPRLSDTMTEGVIAAWHKKIGDTVKKGDLLAEVETDKATMELESYKDGTLLHIGADKGKTLQVNDLLAIIGSPGEDISNLVSKGGAENGAKPASTKDKSEEEPPAKSGDNPSQTAKTAQKPAAAKTEQKPAPAKTEQKPAPPKSGGEKLDLTAIQEVILMPRLSDTMTEGVIAAWHKKVGDDVKKGDLLADVETDKATMELESYKSGKLLYIGAEKGDKVPVNALLCIIGEEGKVDVDKIVASSKGGTESASGNAADNQSNSAAQVETQSTGSAATVSESPAGEEAQSGSIENGRVKASPLAKKLAADKGIDISKVAGSGDGGRIVKADIDNYKPSAQPAAKEGQVGGKQPQTGPSAPAGQVSFEEVPVSQMRKTGRKQIFCSAFLSYDGDQYGQCC